MTESTEFEAIFRAYADTCRERGDQAIAEQITDMLQFRQRYLEAKRKVDIFDEILDPNNEYIRAFNHAGMQKHHNPLFAWGEIALLPQDAPLPAWVRRYLKEAGAELLRLNADKSVSAQAAARKVPAVLGFVRTRPGNWTAFANFRACEKAVFAAIAMLQTQGKREDVAEDLGKVEGKKPRAIFRWVADVVDHQRRTEALRLSRKPTHK